MQSDLSSSTRRLLFFFFFISGFCSLLYQVVWTRLAFAAFGIITPVLSVVLSVFMLGLGVGSWLGGRWAAPLGRASRLSTGVFYGLTELVIGLGAYAVPKLFAVGEKILLSAGQSNSIHYLFFSAVVLAISILPWCLFMGATFPLAMAFLREQPRQDSESFSYLYLANVLGAMSGAILTAVVFVEAFGFHQTLHLAAIANFSVAAAAIFLGLRQGPAAAAAGPAPTALVRGGEAGLAKWVLFSTGFCAMAMEVAWTRAFTPVLKTQVYSFALVVFTYLGATFAGSLWYRRHLKKGTVWPIARLFGFLAISVFLPVLLNDPRLVTMSWTFSIDALSATILLLGICPFCALLGYLTPRLIDDIAAGNPAVAGRVYALNVFGCILGPLAASYLLLPWMSERSALILLSLPFFLFYFLKAKTLAPPFRWATTAVALGLALFALFGSKDFQNYLDVAARQVTVRRDYAASVTSGEGGEHQKLLLVNGIGMTTLTPITKFMADLPMAYHPGPPQSVLVICFGMGTTYRTALTWGANVTVVELIPDVPKAFAFYHPDAEEVLKNPHGHIIIDDGRRFLNRTDEKYDVVVIDPPPPIEAAGSSLLYSKEFYDAVKRHLKPQGILQTWFPGGDKRTWQAFTRTLYDSFPYTRGFISVEGWGMHVLASMDPIESLTPAQWADRLPPATRVDLLEWSKTNTVEQYYSRLHQFRIEVLLKDAPATEITDDHPINEYFLLRRMGWF